MLSDGQIALIVDCDAVAETYYIRARRAGMRTYNAVQLDALRELANIGAGNASPPRAYSGAPSTSPCPMRG